MFGRETGAETVGTNLAPSQLEMITNDTTLADHAPHRRFDDRVTGDRNAPKIQDRSL